MTIDPTQYDIGALRDALESEHARSSAPGNGRDDDRRVDAAFGPSEESTADGTVESRLYRELFLLASSANGLEKPYLSSVPESFAAEFVVLDWLGYLVERTGFKRTMDVLRYYRSINWLDRSVEADLREYLGSIGTDPDGEGAELERTDHLLSLVYIARLATMTAP